MAPWAKIGIASTSVPRMLGDANPHTLRDIADTKRLKGYVEVALRPTQ